MPQKHVQTKVVSLEYNYFLCIVPRCCAVTIESGQPSPLFPASAQTKIQSCFLLG